jgi:hypothetical protein
MLIVPLILSYNDESVSSKSFVFPSTAENIEINLYTTGMDISTVTQDL